MPLEIKLEPGKKAYFASDFHLGAPNFEESLQREKRIVEWLNEVEKDAQVVFLCGDLFDFWFEYRQVVPKGFTRFLGKLASMSDLGIKIYIFLGNHDMWMTGYLSQELGAKIYSDAQEVLINKTSFLIGHGDGLGPGDNAYKFLKLIFKNRICRFLFGRILHPNLGLFLGKAWASKSWKKNREKGEVHHFQSPENELLYLYSKEVEAGQHHDYYVFGHRHYLLDLNINETSKYINLGDWIHFYTYATFDGEYLQLAKFECLGN